MRPSKLPIAVLFTALMCGSLALAAIPKKMQADLPTPSRQVLLQATREALELPMSNRIQALIDEGPQGYRNLVSLMFDEKGKMETRWRAVLAAGMIGGEESKPELERAMKSPDWYMRNAGLVAIAGVSRVEAIKWAKKLASDKALVVRAAAVSLLGEVHDVSAAPMLWKKLYAKENYRGKQSLFIRRRIVEALAQIEGPGHESKFIEVLTDKDESLHVPAIAALEHLTQANVSQPKDTLALKRERWQKWWKDHAASTKL